MLEVAISKGMRATKIKDYMAAWNRCTSDTEELHRRVERATAVKNAAHREMESHWAKKNKVTLTYSLQELELKLWSSESNTMSERGPVLLT